MVAGHRQHNHEEGNSFLGQELKHFSQAGFDLDRIHIKVRYNFAGNCHLLTF